MIVSGFHEKWTFHKKLDLVCWSAKTIIFVVEVKYKNTTKYIKYKVCLLSSHSLNIVRFKKITYKPNSHHFLWILLGLGKIICYFPKPNNIQRIWWELAYLVTFSSILRLNSRQEKLLLSHLNRTKSDFFVHLSTSYETPETSSIKIGGEMCIVRGYLRKKNFNDFSHLHKYGFK